MYSALVENKEHGDSILMEWSDETSVKELSPSDVIKEALRGFDGWVCLGELDTLRRGGG